MRIIYLAIILASLTGAAHATPPRVLTVSDVALAERDGHLLVLRSLEDSLGYHHTVLTSRFLVELGVKGDRLTPLSQTLDHGEDYRAYGVEARVSRAVLPPVDFAGFVGDARALTPAHHLRAGSDGFRWHWSDGVVTVSSFGATGSIGSDAIRQAFDATLRATVAARPPLPDAMPLPETDDSLEPLTDCVFPHLIHLTRQTAVLYADCQSAESGDRALIYLPIDLTRP